MPETRAYQTVDPHFRPTEDNPSNGIGLSDEEWNAIQEMRGQFQHQPAIRQATPAPVDQTWAERKIDNLNPLNRLETRHEEAEVFLLPRWSLRKTLRASGITAVLIFGGGLYVGHELSQSASTPPAPAAVSAEGNALAPK